MEVDSHDSFQYVAVLVLTHETSVARTGMRSAIKTDRKANFQEAWKFENLSPEILPTCKLKFLAEDHQTWFGSGILSNQDYEVMGDQFS
jgi:hypothetical protein